MTGFINISGARIRFDEHGTAHTDAQVRAEGVAFERHSGSIWLCVHRPGDPECPTPSVTYGGIIRSF